MGILLLRIILILFLKLLNMIKYNFEEGHFILINFLIKDGKGFKLFTKVILKSKK